MKKFFSTALLLTAVIFFTGCPVAVGISSVSQKEISLNFTTSIGPSVNELISSVSGQKTTVLFDTATIESSLKNYGFKNISVTNKAVADTQILNISGTIDVSKLDFVSVNKSGSKLKLTIILSPSTLKSFAAKQEQTVRDYIDLLAAPSLSSDKMSKDEYIEFIESVYGEPVAEELTSGIIEIKAAGKTRSLKIIELLTLEDTKEFVFEI